MHTTLEQTNIDSVRRGYEAFRTADGATLTELFAPDAQWIGAPTGVLTGTYRNRNEIFAMFQQLGEETQGTFRAVPTAFAATGDSVYVRTAASGQRKGKSLQSDEVLAFTLADGKITKITFFLNDFESNVAFWS
jgi:uncharacterized protein